MRVLRPGRHAVVWFAFLIATGAAMASPRTSSFQFDPVFFKTCHHYENRAKFKPRHAGSALEVFLAEACRDALDSLTKRVDTSPYERKRATIFLAHLTELKSTVLTINRERLFGKNAGPRTQLQTDARIPKKYAPIGPITRTGEYLIAREIGLLAAYDDWADVTDFEIAGR